MRGCAGKPGKIRKAGRGCKVIIAPAKKRRRSAVRKLRPVIRAFRALAR